MEIFLKFLIPLFVIWAEKPVIHLPTTITQSNSTNPLRGELMSSFYFIKYYANKDLMAKCVEMPGASMTSGTVADIYDCLYYPNPSYGNLHETWYASAEALRSSFVQIRNGRSNLCLGVQGNPEVIATKVIQTDCGISPVTTTFWKFVPLHGQFTATGDPLYRVHNWVGNCLSAESTSEDNGTDLMVDKCEESSNIQKFAIVIAGYQSFFQN